MPPRNILTGYIWQTNASQGKEGRRAKVHTRFQTSPGHIVDDINGTLSGLPAGAYSIVIVNQNGVPFGLWHKVVRKSATVVEPA